MINLSFFFQKKNESLTIPIQDTMFFLHRNNQLWKQDLAKQIN